MTWDRATHAARVDDAARRVRHPAGSPDPAEVAAYLRAASDGTGDLRGRRVVVLGATPELRQMAIDAGASLLSIDRSVDAWEAFGDWVDAPDEVHVQADWSELPAAVDGPVHAVLGDGVIGNLPSLEVAVELLGTWRSVLHPTGSIVLRQVLVPGNLDPATVTPERLLAAHRTGQLDAAEFGFAVRLLGHLQTRWDPVSGLLDGAALYEDLERWRPDPPLTEAERGAIDRYVFRGTNLVPREEAWSAAVASAGLQIDAFTLTGRHWYGYYPVQRLRPVR